MNLIAPTPPSQTGAISSTHHSSLKFSHPIPPLFTKRTRPRCIKFTKPIFNICNAIEPITRTAAENNPVPFLGSQDFPLQGAIQFHKPVSSSVYSFLSKWGCVALLAGGDVLALLLFASIGRFSNGFSVLDLETLKTADPFIAGWFLAAYFLGGYSEDGRCMNGFSKAVTAAVKSWSLGIPLGLIIRTAAVGHILPTNFMLLTMGSTAVLVIGWRSLLFRIIDKR